MPMPLTVWLTTNWKILQEMGLPDYLTCLLRNLYADQEATVRPGHGKIDWFQIGCIFNLHAEYIIENARLEESQVGPRFLGKITTLDMQVIPI